MIEGSGSGSEKPKNTWIRWILIRIRIRIRIRNTAYNLVGYLVQLERLGGVDRQAGAEEAQ
jgi:hypothetical protein